MESLSEPDDLLVIRASRGLLVFQLVILIGIILGWSTLGLMPEFWSGLKFPRSILFVGALFPLLISLAAVVRKLRTPKAVVEIGRHGFIAAGGRSFGWDEIKSIKKRAFPGIPARILLKDGSTFHFDNTEISQRDVRRAMAFIKANAPAHLTSKL